MANHFDYRSAVDDYNNKRHDGGSKHGLSIKEAWRTTNWCICVFSFILAITEVNAFLMMKFFGGWKGTQLEFRKKLAYELIHNALDVDGAITRSLVSVRPANNAHHAYISFPPFSKWIDGKWKKVFVRGYQQMTCSGDSCTKRVRKVCICDPTSVLCSRCYTNHLVTASNDAIAKS